MVAKAKARGLELTGPNGLSKLFTRNSLETALNEEMTGHLGHEKCQPEPGRESTNVRNGSGGKRMISGAAGEVRTELPWARGRKHFSGPCLTNHSNRPAWLARLAQRSLVESRSEISSR